MKMKMRMQPHFHVGSTAGNNQEATKKQHGINQEATMKQPRSNHEEIRMMPNVFACMAFLFYHGERANTLASSLEK